MIAAMRSKVKIVFATGVVLSVLLLSIFWPGFPGGARLRQSARRVTIRLDSKLAAWFGRQPVPVSLQARVVGDGALVEALKGAQVVALESTSGYAVLSDDLGRFTVPHLVWYPGATYTLLVTADAHHAKQFKVRAPATTPGDGIIDAGDLRFEEGAVLQAEEKIVRFLKYDGENRGYYKALCEKLTASSRTDHQVIDALCKYVATRHSAFGDPRGFKSARQILEMGAPHCSNLAFALAALTSAAGYPTRTVHTSDTPDYTNTHVAVEVFYAEGWRLYDPTYGNYFLDESGAVVSYKELRLKPSLMTTEAFRHLPPETGRAALAWMPAAYGSGLHQIYHIGDSEFADACPVLN